MRRLLPPLSPPLLLLPLPTPPCLLPPLLPSGTTLTLARLLLPLVAVASWSEDCEARRRCSSEGRPGGGLGTGPEETKEKQMKRRSVLVLL